ncbi:helix-turn-helix domain-containing protein [Paracoccus litorisediminis]|uniref:helix-turn-helix domain-containing protein n=1 Tax=Paracoccus litorisediminis TaxID=2006130 RepID=UPI00372F5469
MAVFQSIPRAFGTGMGEVALVTSVSTIWQSYRCLSEIRADIGLARGALATLRALLSFLKEGQPAFVYAANKTISARAEGCPERSIRNHLAKLVEYGLISRRSSGNGKRFRIEDATGDWEAFGLDLSPFLAARESIQAAAVAQQQEGLAVRLQRKRLSALIWRATCATVQPAIIAEFRPMLRRKVGSASLVSACCRLEAIVVDAEASVAHDRPMAADALPAAMEASQGHTPLPSSCHFGADLHSPASIEATEHPPCPAIPEEMAANDGNNGRHKNRTENTISDSEVTRMRVGVETGDAVMLEKLIDANPDLASWSAERPRSWFELEELALRIGEWSGIGRDLLTVAIKRIGRRESAIRLLAVGKSLASIRDLPAYFNAVSIGRKAASYDPLRVIFTRAAGTAAC